MKTNEERLAQVQCMANTLFNRGWLGFMIINDIDNFAREIMLDNDYPDIVDIDTAIDFMNAVIMEIDYLEEEEIANYLDSVGVGREDCEPIFTDESFDTETEL